MVLIACSGRGALAPDSGRQSTLRVSQHAHEGDAARRASQQLVLEGLDADANLLPDSALRLYETSIQVDPTNPFAYLAIARHHVDGEDPRRALPVVEQAELLFRAQGAFSPRVEAHLVGLRGSVLYETGQLAEASPLLARARAISPSVWSDGHLRAQELR